MATDLMGTVVLSVVIPCRNEARTIVSVLEDLGRQKCEEPYEVIVADGCSDDGTWDLVRGFENADGYRYQLRLLKNSSRGVSAGLNLAISHATGEFIVRVDGHARLEKNYLQSMLAALRTPGVDVVGPAIRYLPSDKTPAAQVIAAVLNSRFGNGGTPSRNRLRAPVRVRHAVMSAYRRRVWEELGGYDETLGSNEDFEFDYRADAAGLRIFAFPTPTYYARSRANLRAFVQQRWRYGLAKAKVLFMFPGSLHLRQLVPILALPALLLTPLSPALVAGGALIYLLLSLVMLFRAGLGEDLTGARAWTRFLLLGVATVGIAHFVWSAGVWWGFASLLLGRNRLDRGAPLAESVQNEGDTLAR